MTLVTKMNFFLQVLPAVILSTLICCTYCLLSYPSHSFCAHAAQHHTSSEHTACCQTFHTPILHILPIVILSALLSCMSYIFSSACTAIIPFPLRSCKNCPPSHPTIPSGIHYPPSCPLFSSLHVLPTKTLL